MPERQLRSERPGHTLNSTALVHEAYLKLVDQTRVGWQNRAPAKTQRALDGCSDHAGR